MVYYDQAQTHSTNLTTRDDFKIRMESLIDGKGKIAWKTPDIADRVEFLTRMQVLANPTLEIAKDDDEQEVDELSEIEYARKLFTEERLSEASFICRRLAAEGDLEARTLAEQIREVMNGE